MVLAFVLLLRANATALLHTWLTAGWMLLWLIPYRGVFFFLYALGWMQLLRPYLASQRVSLTFLFWVTAIREAIDRLLPVASVGGGVVAVRLLRARGLTIAMGGATVLVEIVLTLWASYLFAVVGVFLTLNFGGFPTPYRFVPGLLLCVLPVPVIFMILLRRGAVFARLENVFSAVLGVRLFAEVAVDIDRELRACLLRSASLLRSGGLYFAALASVTFETWFALRLFGHPISVKAAVILESATQAIRHVGFFVPGGLGIQEAGLVLVGQALGINTELAMATSLAKRMRELACGLPALLWWQWIETWRKPASRSSH